MASYQIIPERSTVSISGRSTLHPIRAEASGLTGWMEVEVAADEVVDDAISGHVEIPVNRLASGNALVDRETRRRIDARRFPLITGDVTSIIEVRGGVITMTGIVGFRGEEVEVRGDVIVREESGDIVLVGESVFDVRWWGLQPPKLFALKVHPEIKVEVALALTRSA